MKSVAIVNDIPGVGKVAGNINFPYMSAAGFEVGLLPTVILSSQTGPGYNPHIHRLGEDFNKIMAHWERNDIVFDGYMTGYFGSPQQVTAFRNHFVTMKDRHPHIQLTLDPIMGDGGDFYPSFDQDIAQSFALLFPYTDIALPNLTEACLISGLPYKEAFSQEDLEALADYHLDLGLKNIAITGVKAPESYPGQTGFYWKRQGDAQGKYIMHKHYDHEIAGTGDVAMSAVSAYYFAGYSIEDSLAAVGPYIEGAFDATIALKRKKSYGLHFEGTLGRIHEDLYDKVNPQFK